MMFRAGVIFLAFALPASAAVIGTLERYPGLKPEILAQASASERPRWQAYLTRSAEAHNNDMAVLEAERKGLRDIPAPAPASMHDRSMPLDKPVAWYGSSEARAIADNILSFQTPAGGWGKNQDFTKGKRARGQMWVVFEQSARSKPQDYPNPAAVHWHYTGTIDNDATTTQLRFLAKVIAGGGDGAAAWQAGFLKGLDYLFAAEFPSGGWPQIWPLEGGYSDALTYNDDAIANVIGLLNDVAKNADGLYGFVPAAVKAKAAAAVKRARAVILASQVVIDGKRTVWGQQHDPITLKIVPARNFEPAMLSATESAALLVFLMKLDDLSPEEIAAVHAGAAWLKAAAIEGIAWEPLDGSRIIAAKPGAPVMWARFYDPKTMKPVFGDVDKTIHDNVNEISAERRAGYSWYNTAPEKALKAYNKWVAKHPAE